MQTLVSTITSTNNSPNGILPGLLIGFFCTANGFMFHVGSLNLRICDIFFFLLLIYWILVTRHKHYFYNNNIKKGLFIVFFIFFWITFTGIANYNNLSPVYQNFFLKYAINKLLWIPIYAFIFMAYGGSGFLYGVFYGISLCSLLNTAMVIYEYIYIQGGSLPKYEFIKSLGIYIDEKKNRVINQGMIRPTGLMLDPNYTGGYTGIGIIFFDSLYQRYKKIKYLICSIICAVPMFLVFSRTGLFSILLCFLLSIYIRAKYGKRYSIIYPWVIGLSFICAILILSYILALDYQTYEMLVDRLTMNDSSAGVRSLYIDYYLSLANPIQIIFGVGNAGYFMSDFWGTSEVWGPESSVIALFIEQGLLFMTIYLIVLIYIFKKLININYHYAMILVYINLIGLSYNFLGDRVYFFLTCCLTMYCFSSYSSKNIKSKFNHDT